VADTQHAKDHPAIRGAIIAGGESTRFGGVPKGLCQVGGARIVDRVAKALGSVAQSVMLVANDPAAHGWLVGVPVYADDRTERASLVGVETAIRHARGPVLVVAWDMPFVSAELLALIVSRWSTGTSAVAPWGPRGIEPLCALYGEACLPAIAQALGRGDRRAGRVVSELHGLVMIPPEDIASIGDPERLFFNVNTPADLERAAGMAQ
jgi:molybdopterin-guanine dinucleotide biosynthesis protein A